MLVSGYCQVSSPINVEEHYETTSRAVQLALESLSRELGNWSCHQVCSRHYNKVYSLKRKEREGRVNQNVVQKSTSIYGKCHQVAVLAALVKQLSLVQVCASVSEVALDDGPKLKPA